MTIRLLKSLMVFSVGGWALLVAWGNVADPESNWQFVQHVLSMDTVFPTNPLRSRAILDPAWQAAAYGSIIIVQWAAGILCVAGAWFLFRARRSRAGFVRAKPLAACGLVLAFMLYFVGFVMIGGEWFSSWQSETWNGQPKAVMFLGCLTAVLVVLLLGEEGEWQAPKVEAARSGRQAEPLQAPRGEWFSRRARGGR